LDVEGVDGVQRSDRREPCRDCLGGGHAVGNGDDVGGGGDEPLGEGPVGVRAHAVNDARDAVADGDPLDVGPHALDGARDVPAQDDREVVRQHVPHVARGDRHVEAVHRRGLDVQSHLAGTRVAVGKIVHGGCRVPGLECEGAHDGPPVNRGAVPGTSAPR
jgi:hypothetical protein